MTVTLLHLALPLGSVLNSFSDAVDFILHPQAAQTGGTEVGGVGYIWPFVRTHLEVSGLALAGSLVVSLPIGLWLGHRGRGELFAVALGNAGRAVPELAVIAFLAAFIGVGLQNVTIALMVLGIPPIPHALPLREPRHHALEIGAPGDGVLGQIDPSAGADYRTVQLVHEGLGRGAAVG